MTKPAAIPSQSDKFKQAARELECDEDEKRFNERLRKAGEAQAGGEARVILLA